MHAFNVMIRFADTHACSHSQTQMSNQKFLVPVSSLGLPVVACLIPCSCITISWNSSMRPHMHTLHVVIRLVDPFPSWTTIHMVHLVINTYQLYSPARRYARSDKITNTAKQHKFYVFVIEQVFKTSIWSLLRRTTLIKHCNMLICCFWIETKQVSVRWKMLVS